MAASSPSASFVIPAQHLPALNSIAPDYPRPKRLEWINRTTDQPLRRTTVEMLLRTLFQTRTSQSAARLRCSSGLRVVFANEADRWTFAMQFRDAQLNGENRPDLNAMSEID